RDLAPLVAGVVEGAAELLEEEDAVREAGEGVVVAEPADRGRGLLLLRDVDDEAAHEPRAALGVREGPALVAPPADAPFGVEDAVLARERLLRRPRGLVLDEDALAVVGVDAGRPGLGVGQPLGRGEAGHGPELRAHVDEAAALVGPRDVAE